MHTELSIPLGTLFGFLLVLSRVSGVIVLAPIPGISGAPEAARIVLALALTCVLLPSWPSPPVEGIWLGKLLGWIAAEFAFGLLTGVCLSLLLEGVQVASQIIGLQAGYSFASTIDPSTQADSTVLQTATQLLAGVLFFALGLDRMLVRVLAQSFDSIPAVAALPGQRVGEAIIHLGSQMLLFGVRLALPVMALAILLDLSIAILGRLNSQFHIQSVSFPAKMMTGLVLLGATLAFLPAFLQRGAQGVFGLLAHLLDR